MSCASRYLYKQVCDSDQKQEVPVVARYKSKENSALIVLLLYHIPQTRFRASRHKMHFSSIAKTLLLFTGLILAQQSAPFNLALLSTHKSLNGSLLDACHVAAAYESICLLGQGDRSYTEFRFNASHQLNNQTEGYLFFNLPIGDVKNGGFVVPSPAQMQFMPSTNVAYPLLIPADNYTADFFVFDANNLLAQMGPLDPSKSNYEQVPFYRWYVCDYNIFGYQYRDLVWVMGKGRPEAANCDKVNVTWVFV
ncbi:hypothetical protein CJF31_00003847 [Rutstroemia sp. NJR-2017a BVV2]|nr:hypothetical protein CJF31_00003847 [Rutstroemia sp. NJR-2017a BVV2]